MTENDVEQFAIAWFQEVGWNYRHGPDIAPDSEAPARSDWRDVVLSTEVSAALMQLNPGCPAIVRDEALHTVTHGDQVSLSDSNRQLHELLCDGVPVETTGSAAPAWPTPPSSRRTRPRCPS